MEDENEGGALTYVAQARGFLGRAEVLHINFHELSGRLDASAISSDLADLAERLDLLQPLTG